MTATLIQNASLITLADNLNTAEEAIFSVGSDVRLDYILALQQRIKTLTSSVEKVNELIEVNFNDLSVDESKEIVLRLTGLISKAVGLIHQYRRLDSDIQEGIKSCLRDFKAELKDLQEFNQDIIRYKINDSDALKKILTDAE